MTSSIPIAQQLDSTWATMGSTMVSDNSNAEQGNDYLLVRPVESSIESILESNNPINYRYLGDTFVDMSRSYFRGKCKIINFTAATDPTLTIVNNPISQAWGSGLLQIGTDKPEQIDNYLPIVDNVMKSVSASKEWMNGQGKDECFYLDEDVGLSTCTALPIGITVATDPTLALKALAVTAPAKARRARFFTALDADGKLTAGSVAKTVNFLWKPAFGIMQTVTKPFYNVPINITLNRSNPDTMFCPSTGAFVAYVAANPVSNPVVVGVNSTLAYGSTGVRLQFTEMNLMLCIRSPSMEIGVQLKPSIASALTQYQYRTPQVQKMAIPLDGAGTYNSTCNFAQKPRVVYVVFRKNARDTMFANSAVNDSLSCERISLMVNNKRYGVGSMNEVNMSYVTDAEDFIDPISQIRKIADVTMTGYSTESLINVENFGKVHNIYAFDLSNSGDDSIPEMNRTSCAISVNAKITTTGSGQASCYVIAIMDKVLEVQGIERQSKLIY